jgi:hypothetical protein
LAQTDALARLFIEKSVIAEAELQRRSQGSGRRVEKAHCDSLRREGFGSAARTLILNGLNGLTV